MSDPVSQIFDRYLDQPPTLPTAVRRRVEQACQGEIIQLYALVYRLTYNDDVAAGQLAVFQGASDEHI